MRCGQRARERARASTAKLLVLQRLDDTCHLEASATRRLRRASHLEGGKNFQGEHLGDLAIRFIIGGLFVTAFAVTGDLVKPKSFAGIFGAAPSVALATLGLTIAKNGKPYAALEARSMLAGAAAMLVYCVLVFWLLRRRHRHALAATSSAILAWFMIAFGTWYVWLR